MRRLPSLLVAAALVAGGVALDASASGALDHCAKKPGPGVNLAGCDLSARQLAHVNLSGANLRGANLKGASLYNSVLFGTDLTGANLEATNLVTANLTLAKLNHARMAGATVVRANFQNATLVGVSSGKMRGRANKLPVRYFMKDGFIFGPGVNLQHQSLRHINLRHANLSRVNLAGADLAGANLAHVVLSGSILVGANLHGARIARTVFTDAKLFAPNKNGVTSGALTGVPIKLPGNYKLVNGYLVGPGADLAGARLVHAYLPKVNLTGANLDHVNFAFSVMWNAIFSVNSMRATSFAHASLLRANISNVDARTANFSGTILTGLRSSAVLSRRLPPGWVNVAGHLLGPGADVEGADLSHASFGRANLDGAILTGTNLTGSVLVNARLAHCHTGRLIVRNGPRPRLPRAWVLFRGYLLGPGAPVPRAGFQNAKLATVNLSAASLTRTILQNADLSRANLTHASLVGVNLQHANLSHAALGGISSSRLVGVPASLPAHWHLVAGTLVRR